ncbi:NAC domain-containing protein 86-like isoform X2 [Citrus sinensis]|uniref:NAC domain-containing protein 86-like isoform X2 n=1 Tax=Citrus sinensis TaxID=2711 RepID=UPI00227877D9|nr:NAC domain-containing protein 86-like isoform X2 [Citrus sinensis]
MDSLTGIGFRPLDEEIIDLLKKKRLDRGFSVETIKEIDFYSFDPWDLAGLSEFQSMQDVCYFFSKPKYRGAKRKRSGQQQHRKTKSGTWKKTGSDSEMKRKNSTEVIGNKDYLVFIHNDATSEKVNTKWLMHEIAIADDPLYKENFVVCRLERKTCDKKLGVSTTDKHQSSQDFASSSSINVVEDMSLESAQPPDRHLVSKTTQIVENINLKNHLQPSENLFSCNEDSAATTSLDSGLSPSDCLIHYSGNHVAENTSTGLQLVPHDVLESLRLPDEQWALEQESSYSNGPSFGGDLLNSQFDSGQAIAFSESQQLPNHLISCSRNHVAENTSTGLQLVLHPVLESWRSPDEQRATYSIDVVENSFESPTSLEQESSYSNGPSFGGDLLNSQFDSGQVIAFSESQQLPNHLTSCSRNHVAENTSTGLQLVPHPVLESLRESKDN